MGLYGERVGAVSFVCSHEGEAAALMSQAKQRVIRPPPYPPPYPTQQYIPVDTAMAAVPEFRFAFLYGQLVPL